MGHYALMLLGIVFLIAGLNKARADGPGRPVLIKMSGGRTQSLALDASGRIWFWGSYSGINDPTLNGPPVAPTLVAGIGDVMDIAAGANHNVALKRDGTVWTWGGNFQDALGPRALSDTHDRPQQVQGLSGITAVAAGLDVSLALDQSGQVWAWGWAELGQQGDGSDGSQAASNPVPHLVPALTDVIALSASLHVLALKRDGTVFAWGYNYAGQVGNGSLGGNVLAPVQVVGLSDVAAISAGYYHSLALKRDGTLWAWGTNWSGNLGDGTRESPLDARTGRRWR